jgi:hypothetical protein
VTESTAGASGAPELTATRGSWLGSLTAAERRALVAAGLGWMFDSMDFLIYVLAIGRLKSFFGSATRPPACSAR